MVVEPAPRPTSELTPGPQGNNGGSLLSVIMERDGDLLEIEPEVAQKACQEVLEKVKLLHGGIAISNRGIPLELVNADSVHSEIRCLDDPSAQIREEEERWGSLWPPAQPREQEGSGKTTTWLLRLSKNPEMSMAVL
ncbi:Phosphatidylinositol 4-kinase beta [Myotis davidii]|uniref:Phosphatidylinositol 4-kinase beta n=1 Tax=Myotis davidii TaxID=225400 RepID=L5MGJ2_MYODS|nr:Phosphatidylinositol 4-kinase beta [Myotis davidii]